MLLRALMVATGLAAGCFSAHGDAEGGDAGGRAPDARSVDGAPVDSEVDGGTCDLTESCNGIDDDCDGTIDEGLPESCRICGMECASAEYCLDGACTDAVATSVDAQVNNTCVVLSDGRVACWGDNWNGEINGVPGSDARTPTLAPVEDALAVGVGRFSTCALLAGGAAVCWGNLSDCDSPDGGGGPAQVMDLPPATSLVSGRYHCATSGDGDAYCWGCFSGGAAGIDFGLHSTPLRIEVDEPVVQVSVGIADSCVTVEAGDAYCWGWGPTFGLDSRELFDVPVRAPFDGPVDRLSVGAGHTCVITTDQYVRCVGDNAYGQLGTGGPDATMLRRVPLAASAQRIAAGPFHTCAVLEGVVYCWGLNSYGQCGLVAEEEVVPPQEVVGLPEPATDVAVGVYHSCALTESGRVYCWGFGSRALGSADVYRSGVPVLALGPEP